jgi:hypothetical protein
MTGVAAGVESTTQAPDEPDLQPVFTLTEIDLIKPGAAGYAAPRDAMCKPQHVGASTQSTKGGGAGTEAPYAAMTLRRHQFSTPDRREK